MHREPTLFLKPLPTNVRVTILSSIIQSRGLKEIPWIAPQCVEILQQFKA
jgi:hypothetical protein